MGAGACKAMGWSRKVYHHRQLRIDFAGPCPIYVPQPTAQGVAGARAPAPAAGVAMVRGRGGIGRRTRFRSASAFLASAGSTFECRYNGIGSSTGLRVTSTPALWQANLVNVTDFEVCDSACDFSGNRLADGCDVADVWSLPKRTGCLIQCVYRRTARALIRWTAATAKNPFR